MTAAMDDKILVVGLDGATFDLIDPLVEINKLPTFARLLRGGAAGFLRSTIPALTPPAWVSSVTGVNPGKHGVFDFLTHGQGPGPRPVRSSDWRAESFWHMLNAAGHRVGVLNFPVTYPPFPIEGFMVSGMMTPTDAEDFLHPAGALSWLQKEIGSYRIGVDEGNLIFGRRRAFLADLKRITDLHTEAALRLARRYDVDVLHVIYDGADRLQHYYWHEWVAPPGQIRDRVSGIVEHYQHLDRALEKLQREFNARRIMIYSDHGFGPLERIVHIDYWLALKKYAQLSKSVRSGEARESRSAAERLAYRLGLGTILKRLLPRAVKRVADRRTGAPPHKYDWSRTRVYFASQASQSLSINVRDRESNGIVEPGAAYDELCEALVGELSELSDPVSNTPIFDAVYRRKSLFQGPLSEEANDLILVPRPGHYLVGGDYPELLSRPREGSFPWTGCHRRTGLFILWGPEVSAGTHNLTAEIPDIAPTVLHWLGLQVPEYMDGRVITESFDPSFLKSHPVHLRGEALHAPRVSIGKMDTGEEDVVRRLREMGYLE